EADEQFRDRACLRRRCPPLAGRRVHHADRTTVRGRPEDRPCDSFLGGRPAGFDDRLPDVRGGTSEGQPQGRETSCQTPEGDLMAKTRPGFRQQMERAVEVMRQSVAETRGDGKASPLVGAVLIRRDGAIITASRGELREGDHAEYTLLERKNRDQRLD